MALEAVHESIFSLANILVATHHACDAINEVATSACCIAFGGVGASGGVSGYPARSVKTGAVCAHLSWALVAGGAVGVFGLGGVLVGG